MEKKIKVKNINLKDRHIENKAGFLKNILVLITSQIIIKIIGIIYKFYLTNKNGYGDMGNAIFSAAFQIYALFLTLCSIGIPNAISSAVSTRLSKGNVKGAYKIFKIAYFMFGFIGFALSILLYISAHNLAKYYLNIPETEEILKMFAPSVFLASLEATLKGFFNGVEKMKVTASSQAYEQITKAALIIIGVEVVSKLSGNNTILMAQSVAMSTVLANVVSVYYLMMKYIKSRKEFTTDLLISKVFKTDGIRKNITNILKISVPISLSALLATANKTIDTFTIIRLGQRILGLEEVKIQYGILSGKVDTLISIPYSFNVAVTTALIPSVASLIATKNMDSAKRKILYALKFTIIIGLLFSAIMSLFSSDILKFIFPNAYSGEELLRISSWSIVIVLILQVISGALQGLGDVETPVIAMLIGCAFKFILNTLLIPKESLCVKGAVISSIVSQLIALIIEIVILKKKTRMSLNVTTLVIKPIISLIMMAIIINILKTFNFHFIISMIIGGVIYLVMIVLLKVVSKEEIILIKI